MIEGASWRRWVFFYVPVTAFVVALLFPFYWMVITTLRPDRELYRPWSAPNYAPFWTTNPTLEHIRDLLTETLFTTWMLNTMLISLAATAISLFCGLLAGYALSRLKFPFAGSIGTGIFITYLVPQTLLFIPLSDIIRNFKLGDSPWALILTYPTFLIPFCTWLLMGYFKSIPKELEECARIDGAPRWKAMLYIIFPVAIPGILSAGNIRLYPVVERVHLRAGVPVLTRTEDCAGRRHFGTGAWRRVLLGRTHGGRPAGIDPRRLRLFVLRRILRVRHHWIGEGLSTWPV